MAFSSFTFIIFLLATVLAVRLCPAKLRWTILLIASLIYGYMYGILSLVSSLATTLFAYGAAALADRKQGNAKRNIAWIAVAVLLAYITLCKTVMKKAPLIGVSYYVLSSVAYVLDVKRGKIKAEKNPLKVVGYLTSFLTINQGPFVRRQDFGAEYLAPRTVDAQNLKRGAFRMLWGFLKKMVVADGLSLYVAKIFSGAKYPGLCVCAGVLFYAFQIYMDFSGYMDIICGAGEAMGITVPENFDNPYLSTSVAEFWRRWHITLGAWFKDYLFYPISVSKPMTRLARKLREKNLKLLAKRLTAIIPLIVVWTFTGLWHGATLNYLVWGLLNGTCIVVSMCMDKKFTAWKKKLKLEDSNKLWNLFRIVRTFLIMTPMRICAHSPSMGTAVDIVKGMFTNWGTKIRLRSLGVGLAEQQSTWVILAAFFAVVVFFFEFKFGMKKIVDWYPKQCRFVRCFIAVLLFFIVLVCHGDQVSTVFMYAQF